MLAWVTQFGGAPSVRVRDEAGVWGPTTRLRHVAAYIGLQVVVSRDGTTVAVAPTQESGSRRIGVYSHGHWSLADNPGDGTPSIAGDDAGNLYAATSSVQRGGDGEVTLARRSPSGRWSRTARVHGLGPKPQDVTVLVSPDGRLRLVVGYVDRHWRSTYDSEAYYSTGSMVLGARHWGRPLKQLWKHSAVAADATITPHGAVRMVFQQWLDRVGRRPTAVALRAVSVGAHGSGRTLTLDQQPATLHRGYYDTATGVDPAGVLHTWWRAVPPVPGQLTSEPASDLHAARVATVRSGLTGSTADVPGTALTGGLDRVLETSTVGADAGWVQGAAYRRLDDYEDVVVDGTVVVGHGD